MGSTIKPGKNIGGLILLRIPVNLSTITGPALLPIALTIQLKTITPTPKPNIIPQDNPKTTPAYIPPNKPNRPKTITGVPKAAVNLSSETVASNFLTKKDPSVGSFPVNFTSA